MAEATSNVEFAHKVHEEGHHHPPPADRRLHWLEILESIVLAIVAVATAWSGYQAARWDAISAEEYNSASIIMVLSQEKATLAGHDRLYDIVTFNGWAAATLAGRDKLAAFYQRRFRPEYATAFAAWMKLDPLHNFGVPAGPDFMPEYKNANSQQAEKLTAEAQEHFGKGKSTRETGDTYVKITVLLATVLLLTALSQRFEIFGARATVVAIAFVLLVMSTFWVLSLPRA